eukprot:m.120274 g.120274  ORF g.120274 m.120274 type:complete len:125 (+) comp9574_c0_seq2:777-1151(+)
MFAAVATQLPDNPPIADLRARTSQYLTQHKDEFQPFMTDKDGNGLSDEGFRRYCEEMASTNAWGGQCELRALSEILKMPIQVFQASGPMEVIGEQFSKKPSIHLSYHVHQFGLGAHYNALVPSS